MHVLFAVDVAQGTTAKQLRHVKTFISSAIKNFKLSSAAVKIGLYQFSDDLKELVSIDEGTNSMILKYNFDGLKPTTDRRQVFLVFYLFHLVFPMQLPKYFFGSVIFIQYDIRF